MPLTRNHALEKMRAGGLAIGFGVHHLRSAATPILAQSAGYDWLFIDTEHGALSVHEATQICMAALPTQVTPVVRVCADALDEGTRALDNGAMGIVVPHVNTVQQAKRVAEAFRYPPAGHRSWGGAPAQFGYVASSAAEAQAAFNREVLLVAMIETPEAVANADSIAGVDGISVLLFGTSDLTAEMGIAGQVGHAEVQEAYASVGEACRRHGKFLGMGGVYDEEWAPRYIRMGVQFALGGSDNSLLMQAATARAAFLRGVAPDRASPRDMRTA